MISCENFEFILESLEWMINSSILQKNVNLSVLILLGEDGRWTIWLEWKVSEVALQIAEIENKHISVVCWTFNSSWSVNYRMIIFKGVYWCFSVQTSKRTVHRIWIQQQTEGLKENGRRS